MTGPTLLADFRADWLEHMRLRLKEMGVKVKRTANDSELSHAYWNARHRWIPPHPRRIFVAAEFTCPIERKPGLEALIARFKKGEDVNPFLSTTRAIGKFNDKLLNDWGIQHFHLGVTANERHDDCLFALVLLDAVFFVHVLPHDNYTDRDLVRRVHANWPSLLARFKIPGALPHREDLTDEEVQTLRDKNMVTALQMDDGTMYFPPGGGLMSSGLAFNVLRNSDTALNQVRKCQAWIEANVATVVADFAKQGRPIEGPAIFKLMVDDDHGLWAVEPNAKAKFKLGSIFPPPPATLPIEITG